jgi:hypothetical protein
MIVCGFNMACDIVLHRILLFSFYSFVDIKQNSEEYV